MCGECAGRATRALCARGSSPRVRGMPGRRGCADHGRGIIPACAGNATAATTASSMNSDHPRVCGECLLSKAPNLKLEGSSPRVRGMRASGHVRSRVVGIIPACAGNASPSRKPPCCKADHPRVCGECAVRVAVLAEPQGSSPRVRGMRGLVRDLAVPVRIIPACAGNAGRSRTWRQRRGDHPRVCVECEAGGPAGAATAGSSPRVRGMLTSAHRHHPVRRIIPASAGNACETVLAGRPARDHPRVCGECFRMV